jgi:Glycosyltransferase family 87
MNLRAILSVGFVCVLGLSFNIYLAATNPSGWGVDFNQFYSASKLAGTGKLYDWESLRAIEAQRGQPVPTGRLPIVAYGVKLVSWMPYRAAQITWLIASAAALALFAIAWPGANRMLMAVSLSWSMPMALLLVFGQDTPFFLLWIALGLLLLQRGSPRLAGVLFALCICKYHLALGLPVLLLAQKRWSALLSACAAGVVLMAACFALEGWGWPAQYWGLVFTLSPALFRMPNVHGIASWFPWPLPVEITLFVLVAALLWMVCRRTSDLGVAGAAATAAGLVLARHGYANDCILLLPMLVFTVQRHAVPQWLKLWALYLLTPATALLLTTPKPFAGQIPAVLFVMVALATELRLRGERRPEPGAALPDAKR